MKIGIVTYWKSSCNYGEQLQNYALQEYLKDMGHEPFLIRYDYDSDRIRLPRHKKIGKLLDPKQAPGYLKAVRCGRKLAKESIIHPRGFETFRQRHLSMSRIYSSADDLAADPPAADMYITGSDQVWNSFEGGLEQMRNRLRVFFLDFGGKDVMRASYAASWGRNDIPDEEKTFIKPLIDRFDAVSVRERTGIGICKGLGRDDAVVALDPVMLFDAGKYRELYRGSSVDHSGEKYLFFYYMNNDGDYNRKAVFDLAETMGLKVIYVTDDWHDGLPRSFPDVYEWLNMLDNAEYVVTNSYHCSLLSIVFEKRFGVIRRFGKYAGMNTRMDSLFDMCGMEPRYIDDDDFEVLMRPPQKPDAGRIGNVLTPDQVIGAAQDHE